MRQPLLPTYPRQRLNRSAEGIETDVKRIVRQLRMVTILIQDIRSGTTDNQLAEVKVSLKAADDPEDGFWTDAKELVRRTSVLLCQD